MVGCRCLLLAACSYFGASHFELGLVGTCYSVEPFDTCPAASHSCAVSSYCFAVAAAFAGNSAAAGVAFDSSRLHNPTYHSRKSLDCFVQERIVVSDRVDVGSSSFIYIVPKHREQ